MITNWQKIKETIVYDGHYRKIIRRTFRLPNSQVADYDIGDEGETGGTACVFALTDKNEVILAKQFRPGPERIFNELPGGFIDRGESPEETIKREFLEETGYTGDFQLTGQSWDDAYSTRRRYHFVATHCRKVAEPRNEAAELTEPVLMPRDEFIEYLHGGELSDSETAYRGLEYLKLI